MRPETYRAVQATSPGEPVPGRALSSGSHVVTPRHGYLHHGIYVGGGRVVHYAGLVRGLRSGPVEEIPLAQFTGGNAVRVRVNTPSHFDRLEVIRRARSRVGENRYRLLSNNCEHFCEWCLRGEHRSYQVEALLTWPARMFRTAIKIFTGFWTDTFVRHGPSLSIGE